MEPDPTPKIWASFFKEAGLIGKVCAKYGQAFSSQQVQMRHFLEAVEDPTWCGRYFNQLGVLVGHEMQIVMQAKKLLASQSQTQGDIEVELDFVKPLATLENVIEEEGDNDHVDNFPNGIDVAVPGSNEPPLPCSHTSGQSCLNCSHCNQHLNVKSLTKHCQRVHGLQTTPVRQRKSSQTTMTNTKSSPSDSVPVPPHEMAEYDPSTSKSHSQTTSPDNEDSDNIVTEDSDSDITVPPPSRSNMNGAPVEVTPEPIDEKFIEELLEDAFDDENNISTWIDDIPSTPSVNKSPPTSQEPTLLASRSAVLGSDQVQVEVHSGVSDISDPTKSGGHISAHPSTPDLGQEQGKLIPSAQEQGGGLINPVQELVNHTHEQTGQLIPPAQVKEQGGTLVIPNQAQEQRGLLVYPAHEQEGTLVLPARVSGRKRKAPRRFVDEQEQEIREKKQERKRAQGLSKTRCARPPRIIKYRTLGLSPALAALMGVAKDEKLSRTEVVKRIWTYIKEKKLQDPENKQFFTPDAKMAKIFGKEKIKAFGMVNKYLKGHFIK